MPEDGLFLTNAGRRAYHSAVADYSDLYEVLEVSPNASGEVIGAAYRRLSRKFHPDVDSSPSAAVRQRALNHAFAALSDPSQRAAYDHDRAAQKGSNRRQAGQRATSEPPSTTGRKPPRKTALLALAAVITLAVATVGRDLISSHRNGTSNQPLTSSSVVAEAAATVAPATQLDPATSTPVSEISAVAPPPSPLTGSWTVLDLVTYGQDAGSWFSFDVEIQESGTTVTGGDSALTINGTRSNSQVTATFIRGDSTGTFRWTVEPSGDLQGSYEDGTANNGGTSLVVPRAGRDWLASDVDLSRADAEQGCSTASGGQFWCTPDRLPGVSGGVPHFRYAC